MTRWIWTSLRHITCPSRAHRRPRRISLLKLMPPRRTTSPPQPTSC
jgi:hypothetical protein